jgi:hypothetical protein
VPLPSIQTASSGTTASKGGQRHAMPASAPNAANDAAEP